MMDFCQQVGKAAGFRVSEGRGKRSRGYWLASHVGSRERGPGSNGLYTLLFSNESFTEVCLKKEKLVG